MKTYKNFAIEVNKFNETIFSDLKGMKVVVLQFDVNCWCIYALGCINDDSDYDFIADGTIDYPNYFSAMDEAINVINNNRLRCNYYYSNDFIEPNEDYIEKKMQEFFNGIAKK